jgi:hypothetical protein
MAKLFHVNLKIGRRTITQKWYAKKYQDIQTFVNNNLLAKIIEIKEVVYTAPKTTIFPVDDPTTYQDVFYFYVTTDNNKSAQFQIPTIKTTKDYNDVFNDMKLYLTVGEKEIKSLNSVNVSTK